jgi:hypothetical protein
MILLVSSAWVKILNIISQKSSVGIATGYGLEGRDSIPGGRKRFFSTPQCPDELWGSPNFLSNGWVPRFLPLGVKQPGLEADHTPPSSAEVSNGGAIPPFSLRLHGFVLNYARGELYLVPYPRSQEPS